MNKLLGIMTKNGLLGYVRDHFCDIAVDDYLYALKKGVIYAPDFSLNSTLAHSSDILKEIVTRYPEKIIEFDLEAITEEVVSIILSNGYLHKIEMREDSGEVLNKIISIRPDAISLLNEPSEELALLSIKSGYLPNRLDLVKCPKLGQYDVFLERAFECDLSVFPLLNEKVRDKKILTSAIERGFIAKELDLIMNPILTQISPIMTSAIDACPSLIVYTAGDCFLPIETIKKALSVYEITESDLEQHPNLTENVRIMDELPEYYIYRKDADIEIKLLALKSAIEEDRLEDIPFLKEKWNSALELADIKLLISILKTDIDETNIDIQARYKRILDTLIDGIISLRYSQEKSNFTFPDVVAITDYICEMFDKALSTNELSYLADLRDDFIAFTGGLMPQDKLSEGIRKLYKYYSDKGRLPREISSDLSNAILNQHRNKFFKDERVKISMSICKKLTLTERKRDSHIDGKKVQKITELLREEKYSSLGISRNWLEQEVHTVNEKIKANKKLKKALGKIDDSILSCLNDIFINSGFLPLESIKFYLSPTIDKESYKYIIRQYEKIKVALFDNVELDPEELISALMKKDNLGLNIQNYVIASSEHIDEVLAKIILELDSQSLENIISSGSILVELQDVVPFVDVLDELDAETFINILKHYPKIRKRFEQSYGREFSINPARFALNHIDDLINISNGYSSVSGIKIAALGSRVVNTVGIENADEFLEFYSKMLERNYSTIPNVCLNIDDLTIESGYLAEPERLLIGRITENSCIDLLDTAGRETYESILLDPNANVALIRDKDGNLKSRLLLFRRGNVVQIVCQYKYQMPTDVYRAIAKQIMDAAIESGDNLDYVFVNGASVQNLYEDFVIIDRPQFKTFLPHCDVMEFAVLLESRNTSNIYRERFSSLNFALRANRVYKKRRKAISYSPTETEITRLRALRICLESSTEVKSTMAAHFEPFYKEDYAYVVCGEDWYFALKKDGTTEEMVLPLKDESALDELESEKRKILFRSNEKRLQFKRD